VPIKRYTLADGRVLTTAEMSKLSGIPVTTVRGRLCKQGWSPERAMTTPVWHAKSLVGKVFGRLTILRHVGSDVDWRCSCGRLGRSDRYNVTSGGSRSCGCSKIGRVVPPADQTGRVINGVTLLRLADGRRDRRGQRYLWICRCPQCGGEFESAPGTLINLRAPKCDACRQRRLYNERPRRRLTLFGADVTPNELARLAGVSADTIRTRVRNGMTAEEAAFAPKVIDRFRKFIIATGESLTADEIAKRAGIATGLFWSRFHGQRMTPDQILQSGPPRPHRPYRPRRPSATRGAKP
jgi:DNA-directed RNA polymerase subunit RPC12/RpoP